MSSILVHSMDTPWTSSNPGLLSVAADATQLVEGAASNHLATSGGAAGVVVQYTPGGPLDLSSFDEFRFWVRSERAADGSAATPFFLEFAYVNTGDVDANRHRWLVPVNVSDTWEQRRVGIEDHVRNSVVSLRFGALDNSAFDVGVDELLAVHPEMLADLEAALEATLGGDLNLHGMTAVAINTTVNAGDTQVIVSLNRGFFAGNRIVVHGGTAGDETHEVAAATHNPGNGTTTLAFAGTDRVLGTLTAGVATVALAVPVLIETPPTPTPAVSPAIVVTPLGPREDPARASFPIERDSFHLHDGLVSCMVRSGARAYVADYQVDVGAPLRSQHVFVMDAVLARLSMGVGLRIAGVDCPIWILPAPRLYARATETLGPVFIRVGTRMDVSARRRVPWIGRMDVEAAQPDAPTDTEGLVVVL